MLKGNVLFRLIIRYIEQFHAVRLLPSKPINDVEINVPMVV